MNKPIILKGGNHVDERGVHYYNNYFDLKDIRRFHIIEHKNIQIFRGWQGHKIEQKWFQALNGGFSLLVVQLDDWENPSSNLKVEEFILTKENNRLLHLPGGYATGIKALQPNSQLAVFSSLDLEASITDSFKFESNLWR